MMTLQYSGRAVLMPNDVCEAVLRYAQALAASQGSDVLTIPVIAEDGRLVDAEFLLGPASQLYAMPGPDGVHDRDNGTTVTEIGRRERLLHPTAVITPAGPADPSTALDLDMTPAPGPR